MLVPSATQECGELDHRFNLVLQNPGRKAVSGQERQRPAAGEGGGEAAPAYTRRAHFDADVPKTQERL